MDPFLLLTVIVFLPALGALVLGVAFRSEWVEAIRFFTLGITLVVLVLVAGFLLPAFDIKVGTMQLVFSHPWIPSFDIEYLMGTDGISFPLVALTALVSALAMGASWSVTKYVKGYCILFLLLVTGMLGVFLALDFFLFYVFWEVMLLPMYFLIGVWGGPRKEYAAIKFFLYTLVGSVLMLIAILMLYFNSDLKHLGVAQLKAAHVIAADLEGDALQDQLQTLGYLQQEAALVAGSPDMFGEELKTVLAELKLPENERRKLHTFNIMALQQIGQTTDLFDGKLLWGKSLQWWSFILLFIGFAIKVPSVPVHTWLPDAHVEAPTPISMILAGVLLKMGGYGIIRICYPICPDAGYDLAWWVCGIGVLSMVYGAFAAMAQRDFKRLVAYSSVSHMGYVVLGLGVWSANAAHMYNPDYWNMGVTGAMFQMIAHGVSSAGMFFMVGVVYDRVHHRNLNEFGGLFGKMPLYTALSIGIFFAGLGLPGLCGFVGEVLVVLSVWNFSMVLAVISAAVVILTAGYILWAIQRVYLGPEYKGPHGEALTPITPRELCIAVPLFVLAIVMGILPYQTVLKYMDPTITLQTDELAEWTQTVKRPRIEAAEKAAEEEKAEMAVQPAPQASAEDQAAVDADSPAFENVVALSSTNPLTPSFSPGPQAGDISEDAPSVVLLPAKGPGRNEQAVASSVGAK